MFGTWLAPHECRIWELDGWVYCLKPARQAVFRNARAIHESFPMGSHGSKLRLRSFVLASPRKVDSVGREGPTSRRAQELFPFTLPEGYFDDAVLDSRFKGCWLGAVFAGPGVLKCFFISEESDFALSCLKLGSEKIACKSLTIRIRFTVGIATVTTGLGYSLSSSSITPSVNFVT